MEPDEPGGGTEPGGGEPQEPGGGEPQEPGVPASAPGQKQFGTADDSLIVHVPSYTLQYDVWRPIEDPVVASARQGVDNPFPSIKDLAALESLTSAYVLGYVFETIGNGLNVVLDDLETVILSHSVEKNTSLGSSETVPSRVMVVVSVDFVTTATFDSSSPTIPHAHDLRDHHVRNAFTGAALSGYLGMVQSLHHRKSDGTNEPLEDDHLMTLVSNGWVPNEKSRDNIFASTSEIVWIATPSDASSSESSSSTEQKSWPILVPLLLAITALIGIVILCRRRRARSRNVWLTSQTRSDKNINLRGWFSDEVNDNNVSNEGDESSDEDGTTTSEHEDYLSLGITATDNIGTKSYSDHMRNESSSSTMPSLYLGRTPVDTSLFTMPEESDGDDDSGVCNLGRVHH